MKNNKFCIFVLIMLSSTLGVRQGESIAINNTQKTDIQKIDNKIEEVDVFNSNIVLVNKDNGLEKDNYISEFKIPNVEFISNGDPNVRKMEKVAAEALENLFNDAIKDNIILLGVSGYRDYSYQEKLYNDKVNRSGKEEADKFVAQAGESEHQTGLAMDLLSDEYETLDEGFKNTKAYKWIIDNCYKYGFILRYPEGKEQITGYAYEPWHIRYVGDKVAKEIASKGITLEEYLNISIKVIATFSDQQIGYISKVYEEGGKRYLRFDDVKFLMGKEAIEAAKKNGDAEYENGEYFVYDDYYIVNSSKNTKNYFIADNASLNLLGCWIDSYNGDGNNHSVSYDKFKSVSSKNEYMLCYIYFENNVVVRVEGQYTP